MANLTIKVELYSIIKIVNESSRNVKTPYNSSLL